MMKKEVIIDVDLPPIPKERMESFIDFLTELLANDYLKGKNVETLKNPK
ncbi:MAG: hypothetical protein KOO62_05465 [candidate division Zixibacteria bacterium]|nr:hypothetical protein [candidate division Zixibacteria bacterium]